MIGRFLVLGASLLAVSPATSAVIFSDSFEADTIGTSQTGLVNFIATSGNVDVVSLSSFAIGCSDGNNCVDLDGSNTGGPTGLMSRLSYSFNAGDSVRLLADIGGNQRPSSDPTLDAFGLSFNFSGGVNLLGYGYNFFGADQDNGPIYTSGFRVSTSLSPTDPFGRRSIYFTAADAGSFTFGFDTLSADNYGPILDNVEVDIEAGNVPEPATWALMLVGFGGIGYAARRRKIAVSFS